MTGIKWKGSKDGGMKARVKRMEQTIKVRLDQWVQETATEIRVLTERGLDYRGKKFKKYADSTAAQKMLKLGKTLVNLTDTGSMMDNLLTKKGVGPKGQPRGILYISGASTKINKTTGKASTVSNAEKVRHNEALGRTFFKLSARQYRRLKESMRNLLKK